MGWVKLMCFKLKFGLDLEFGVWLSLRSVQIKFMFRLDLYFSCGLLGPGLVLGLGLIWFGLVSYGLVEPHIQIWVWAQYGLI